MKTPKKLEEPETQLANKNHLNDGTQPQLRNRNQGSDGLDIPLNENWKLLRLIYLNYKAFQKLRIGFDNRVRQLPEYYGGLPRDSREAFWERGKIIKEEERKWQKLMKLGLGNNRTYMEFLRGISGIGEITACGLLGYLGEPRYFVLKSLYHRCGMHCDDNGRAIKLKRGKRGDKKLDWNPAIRTILYQIATSFEMGKNKDYQEYYLKVKAFEFAKLDALTLEEYDKVAGTKSKKVKKGIKGFARNRALRKTAKKFLRDLWNYWIETGYVPPTRDPN